MASLKIKATFSVKQDLLAAVTAAVAQGAAPSKNALVEQALRRELRVFRHRVLAARWGEAAHDPLLLGDVQDAQDAFAANDEETAGFLR
ncbi:MAG TPA: hypothetical protein VK587_09765 [bacterium]|nr:hypothetical protein [bacterium]